MQRLIQFGAVVAIALLPCVIGIGQCCLIQRIVGAFCRRSACRDSRRDFGLQGFTAQVFTHCDDRFAKGLIDGHRAHLLAPLFGMCATIGLGHTHALEMNQKI